MDDSHRNTVYDLTALRLHTDSTRVHQTSDNLTLGKRKDTVHNPRRGWFAKDAGGSLVINNSTKKSSERKTSNANDDDKNPGKDDTTATVTTEQEVGERGRTMKRKNVDSNVQSEKARKKQKFKEDDMFITKLTQNVTDKHRDDAPSSVSSHSFCRYRSLDKVLYRIYLKVFTIIQPTFTSNVVFSTHPVKLNTRRKRGKRSRRMSLSILLRVLNRAIRDTRNANPWRRTMGRESTLSRFLGHLKVLLHRRTCTGDSKVAFYLVLVSLSKNPFNIAESDIIMATFRSPHSRENCAFVRVQDATKR